jgi:hypothetical protein
MMNFYIFLTFNLIYLNSKCFGMNGKKAENVEGIDLNLRNIYFFNL